jgi:hypothetical protein
LASRRQPTPQTFLSLRRAGSGFGAPFSLSSVFCCEMFFVTVQPFGQAAGDVAWFTARLYDGPQIAPQKALQKARCEESNTDDHDDEEQTCSGGFDLNYFAYSKKCDEAQNKPIEGRWRGLSRNSSPCSCHSECSAIFVSLRLFSKALAASQYLLRFAASRHAQPTWLWIAVPARPRNKHTQAPARCGHARLDRRAFHRRITAAGGAVARLDLIARCTGFDHQLCEM